MTSEQTGPSPVGTPGRSHPIRSTNGEAPREGTTTKRDSGDLHRPKSRVLEVQNLTKIFGRHLRAAVDHVSFSLDAGESLAIVGESGSGKTTTARIVAGLETATSGTIFVNGAARSEQNKRKFRKSGAKTIQMVFQDPFGSLDPRQRVGAGLLELLSIHFDLTKAESHERVSSLLQQVGLDERHMSQLPRSLSGGQRQRVAIARALALEPKILILDEAVSALDVSVQAQVLNLLIDVREQTGISYLFVSHDLAVVRQVTDNCIVLHNGKIVESGTTSQVLDSPSDPYTQALLRSVPRPGWKPSRR